MHKNEDSPFFKGVYAPVHNEQLSRRLTVEGCIPDALDGVYMRTGPNPQHEPHGGYTMVDGEAMIHAVSFSHGAAEAYCNHYLRCDRYVHERTAQQNIYIRIGDVRGVPGLLMLAIAHFFPWVFEQQDEYLNLQLGNTGLVYHGGRILALMEGGYPFETAMRRDGQVESVGPFSYGGALDRAMTGHPKIDPLTGEMLTFCYNVVAAGEGPLCRFNIVSPDGRLSRDHPVPISRAQMMHDFAICKSYAVFLDSAVVFEPTRMVTKPAAGMPFRNDLATPSRILLVSRADPSQVLAFEVDPFAFFHTANAWEEGTPGEADHVVHVALCRLERLDMEGCMTHGFKDTTPELYRYSMHVATGVTTATCLVPGRAADFPVVPAQLLGRRSRFAYCAVAGTDETDDEGGDQQHITRGLIKVDLLATEGEGLLNEITFGPSHVGGEATFVPRDADALLRRECDEDDGYLIVYVTDFANPANLRSSCWIYDAHTMSPEPLAKIALPQRVPQGLHGTFVTRQQLHQQALYAQQGGRQH